ncbi:hypothetical protein ACMHYO_16385 [Allopusillimonas ginsengisoli]|uniref:hypothetical protein n=1 Tax=Allopusillimonas ginsengisoli TaxID=453575 RepID=UPI0039C3DE59
MSKNKMNLEIADIVKGSETPAGDGVTGAQRCVLITPGGLRRAAILKRGSVGEIAAECFCALLLRAWGLNTPDPYLVRLNSEFGFGSADVGYPNLKQSLGLDGIPEGPARNAAQQVAYQLTASFKSTAAAIAADEAIGNRDRNLGNILWDGKNEAWIDHAMCLEAGASMEDINKLALIVVQTDKADAIARSAVAQALTMDQSAITESGTTVDSHLGETRCAKFVAQRIINLANLVIARFPSTHSLL